MHNFRPSLTGSLRELAHTCLHRVSPSSLSLMLPLPFPECSTAPCDPLLPQCLKAYTDASMCDMLYKSYHIQFFLPLTWRVWRHYLHFSDKENEVQRGLATFKVTNLSWFIQFIPGFSSEHPLSWDTSQSWADRDRWPC